MEKTTVREMFIQGTTPIIIGDSIQGVRFTVRKEILKTGKNAGELMIGVKEIQQRLIIDGTVDIPETEVIAFIQDYLTKESIGTRRKK